VLTEQNIANYCSAYDYNIRKTRNARWIDQKCTPDVLCVVADCVSEYVSVNEELISFSSVDIWRNKYTADNVKEIFAKPGVENNVAQNEYDKFFAQPLELLAYAGILHKEKVGRTNQYQLKERGILEFIAIRERNALTFLNLYIESVLSNSGMMAYFDDYFDTQTDNSFKIMKDAFEDFTIRYTPINGRTEIRRIFTKVLNPMAFIRKKCGTLRGRMSKDIITMDMLMYNRLNFRDIYAEKPRNMTRKEYSIIHPPVINEAFYHYQSTKAKRFLRLWNDQFRDGKSEYEKGITPDDKATNIHHIFSENQYPEISFFLENLIALTPTQHYNEAHSGFRTQEINEQYQHILLLAKAEIIRWNIDDITVETIYEFERFIYVLSMGFDKDIDVSDLDFPSIIQEINQYYT
jgi:hypothetical protein